MSRPSNLIKSLSDTGFVSPQVNLEYSLSLIPIVRLTATAHVWANVSDVSKHKTNVINVFFILFKVVLPKGFEPLTHRLEICCSIQLSYETINIQKKRQ